MCGMLVWTSCWLDQLPLLVCLSCSLHVVYVLLLLVGVMLLLRGRGGICHSGSLLALLQQHCRRVQHLIGLAHTMTGYFSTAATVMMLQVTLHVSTLVAALY